MSRERVSEVGARLVARPWELVVRWNWKSAFLSSVFRAQIFLIVNWAAGPVAALNAMLTESVLRATTSGFYGAITQSFRLAEPRWAASLTVVIMLPFLTHSMELLAHWLRGTPELLASILASVCFTALSTAFHLFAMRRGVLIVGQGSNSLLGDLKQTPRLVWMFIRSGLATVVR